MTCSSTTCPVKDCDGQRGHCRLDRLGVGCCGRVAAIGGEPGLRRRLLEMGLVTGTPVECVRRSPFGDPIEFRLRGYHLSLRGHDAACVTVEQSSASGQ